MSVVATVASLVAELADVMVDRKAAATVEK
jgi:hypothetical protein